MLHSRTKNGFVSRKLLPNFLCVWHVCQNGCMLRHRVTNALNLHKTLHNIIASTTHIAHSILHSVVCIWYPIKFNKKTFIILKLWNVFFFSTTDIKRNIYVWSMVRMVYKPDNISRTDVLAVFWSIQRNRPFRPNNVYENGNKFRMFCVNFLILPFAR